MPNRILRVLIVDRSKQDAAALAALMNAERRTVFEVCDNATDAMELIKSRPPDLIILDLAMPHHDGVEVLARVKLHDQHRRIPIVILTADDRHTQIARAYHSSANAYVCKPDTAEEMAEVAKAIWDFWIRWNAYPPESH